MYAQLLPSDFEGEAEGKPEGEAEGKAEPYISLPRSGGVFNRISTGNTYAFNRSVWKTICAEKSVIFFHGNQFCKTSQMRSGSSRQSSIIFDIAILEEALDL